jgi:predicted hotdog family 3-hydroxylacyl-ACP dehydratase
MTTALPIDRSDFEHLIPHAGEMCLLARVVACDDTGIRCEADSHRDAANPLRNARGLPVSAGIEYAAQAMALHAALQRDGSGAIQSGAIAVLSDVAWTSEFLDGVEGPLSVEARLLAGTGGGRQYSFAVGPRDAEPVVTGTVVVAFT